MHTCCILVAAGTSNRLVLYNNKKERIKKQFFMLAGNPIFLWTLEVLEKVKEIGSIIIVLPRKEIKKWKPELLKRKKVVDVVAGGDTRQESVNNALQQLPKHCELIATHDAVRPLVKPILIKRVIYAAKKFGAAVLATPVKETIKRSDGKGFVLCTIPRPNLWAIQTPQVFHKKLLWDAYADAIGTKFVGTDDAQLVERMAHPVKLVKSDYENVKITTTEDLIFVQNILISRR